MDRVDFVEVRVTGYNRITGPQTIAFEFDVSDQESTFVRGFREELAKYRDKLLIAAKNEGADPGILF